MACLRTARIPAGRPPGLPLTGKAAKRIKTKATADQQDLKSTSAANDPHQP
jgi:hypothetical protein